MHMDVFKLSRPSEPHLPAIMFCRGSKTRAACWAGGAGRRAAAAAAGKHPSTRQADTTAATTQLLTILSF
ncbi:hypothetical protein E2C01_038311 [Portunus trituberculatus]|uniref:Uncharacterized protein n=1 Tax=Portunus trituberculatus TaxID=210409 RepID=A0A5B7FJN4_PORTR|nr:hypothetical protein [Portunus trituberculatus]